MTKNIQGSIGNYAFILQQAKKTNPNTITSKGKRALLEHIQKITN